jgi:hypothetical protein
MGGSGWHYLFVSAKSNVIVTVRIKLRVVFIGNGVNVLIQESLLDGDYIRFAYLSATPFLLCVSLVIFFRFVTFLTH